jgi:hypothetical protein
MKMPRMMPKIFQIPAALLMLAALATGALGSERSTDLALPAEALKIALIEWIGANSDYDVSAIRVRPPAVKFCEHGTTLVYQGKAIHFGDRLNGVYDETTEQICLAKPWNASNTKDRGILLHELVHHVQYQSKSWACAKATEWEAYKLQEAWLLEKGAEPGFNWMYILLASSCTPRDVHP